MKDKKKIIIGAIALAAILIIVGIILVFTNKKEDQKENQKEKNEVTNKDETVVVGTDTYGYITVPGGWIKFEEKSGPIDNGYQYSDPKGEYIITISRLTATYDGYIANLLSYLSGLNAKEVQEENIVIDGHDAHKISAITDRENITVIIIPDNNFIRSIGYEGPDINNEYLNILYTFKLEK